MLTVMTSRALAVAGLILALVACAPEPSFSSEWARGADAPMRLTEVGSAAFDGRIWAVGGLTSDGNASAAVLIYDPAADSWRRGPDLPVAVHHPALVGGDRLYLIGGYAGHDATDQVWILDGERWISGPRLPEPRAAGAAAWDGKRLVYGGGVLAPQQPKGDVFALENGQWRTIGAVARPREHLGAASDGNGRVWFLGGRTSGLESNVGDADLVQNNQITRVGELPTPRGGVAGFYAGNRGACLAGGEHPAGTNSQVECIDERGNVARLPDLGHARHGLGAAVIGDTAYVVLGGPKPGLHVSATVERLGLK
jgi:hypothetical protein